MKTRLISIIAWSIGAAFLVAATWYVFFSNSPGNVVSRTELVILATAVLGIPLGIRLGTQEKSWT